VLVLDNVLRRGTLLTLLLSGVLAFIGLAVVSCWGGTPPPAPAGGSTSQPSTPDDGGTDPPPVPQNRPPTIGSIEASPANVMINQQVILSCIASDPDDDSLVYTWSGDASGAGASLTWTAPAMLDTYRMTCTVSDGENSVQADVEIQVLAASGDVALDASSYMGTGSTATVVVADEDKKGAGSLQVTAVSASTDTAGETITLTETATGGIFRGVFGFERPFSPTHQTPIVSGNGFVGIYAEGDRMSETITVSYDDAVDASGAPAKAVDTATYEEPSSTITGIVDDGAGHPIDGAVVEIAELGWQAATRSATCAGHFSFYDVPSGTYTLVVAHDNTVLQTIRGVVVP